MKTNDISNGGIRSVLVQTTLRVAETDEDIQVVSDRGIQTIASTLPTNDNHSFIPFLEFTPYSEIEKDSQKILDLPRKAALQFNLENRRQKKSLQDINPKSVLKKSMSNTTVVTGSGLLLSQHIVPTMSRTTEEREIQTDLTVNPYILDEDTVANVCTQLSVQTSITFEPTDSLTEITQALKKAIVHTKNFQAIVVDGKLVTDYADPDIEKASRVTVSERYSSMQRQVEKKTSNISEKISNTSTEIPNAQEENGTPITGEDGSPNKPVTHIIQTSVPMPLNMTEEEFEANVQRILDQTVKNVYEFMAKIVEMYEQSKDADGKYVETPLSKELRKQAMAPQKLFQTVDEGDEEIEVSEATVTKEESESLEKKPPPLTRTEATEDDPDQDPSEPKTPIPQKQPSALEIVTGLIRGPKWFVQQTLNVDVKTGLPTPGKQEKEKDESIDMGEEYNFEVSKATIEFIPIDTDEAEKHFSPKKEPLAEKPEEGVVEDTLEDQVQNQEKEESAEQDISADQEKPQTEEIVGDTTVDTSEEKPQAEDVGAENIPSTTDEENQDTTDATPQEPAKEDIVVIDATAEKPPKEDEIDVDATVLEEPKGDEVVAEAPKEQEVVNTIAQPQPATDDETERPETPPPSLIDIAESMGDSKVKPISDIPCECSRIHEAGAAPPSLSQPAIKFEVTVLSDAKRNREGAEGVIVQASVSRPEEQYATCKDMNINFSVTVGGQTFTPGGQLAIEGASEIETESCTCKEEQEKEKLDHEESQGSLPGTSDDYEECVCPEELREQTAEENEPPAEEITETEDSKEEPETGGEDEPEEGAPTEPVTEEHTETPAEPPKEEVEPPTEQEIEARKEETVAITEETEPPKREIGSPQENAPTWKECKCEKSEPKAGADAETQTEREAEQPPAEPNEKDKTSIKRSIGSSFVECICTESETQSEAAVDHPGEHVSTKLETQGEVVVGQPDDKQSTKSEPESFVECICTSSETKPSKVGSGKQSRVTISAPPSKETAKPSGDQIVGRPEESEKPSEMEIGPPTEYPEQTELSVKEGSQKIKQESQEFLACGCRKSKSTSTIKKTVCICEDKSKVVKKESQELLECGCRKPRPTSPIKKPVCACADKAKPIPQESQEFLECGCRKQRPPSPIKKPICTCADNNKPIVKESQEFLECGCRKRPTSPVRKPVCTCANHIPPMPKKSEEVVECKCKTKRPPSPPKKPVCICKVKEEVELPDLPLRSSSPAQKVCGCQFPEQREALEKYQSEPIQQQALAHVGTCMDGDAQAPCKQQSAPLRTNESIPKKINQTLSLPTQNVSTDYDTVEPVTQKDPCICPQPGKYDESIEEYIKKLISESITTRDPELIQTHAACIGPFLQKFAGKLGQQAEGVSGRPIKCTGDAEQQCSCSVQILYVNDGSQPADTAEKACTCAIPKEQLQQRQDAVEPTIAAKSCHCDIDNEPSPNLECMYEEDNDYSEMYMEELQSGDGFRLEKIESDKVICECPEELPPVLVDTDKCTSNIEIPWLSIVLPPPGTIVIKPTREIKKKRCDCWELDLKDSVLSATEPPVDDKVEKPKSPSKTPSKQSAQSKSSSNKSPPKSPKSPSKQSTPPKSPSKQSSPPKSPSNQSKPTEEAESPEQQQETTLQEGREAPDQPPDAAEPGESEPPQPDSSSDELGQSEAPPLEDSEEPIKPPSVQSEQPENAGETASSTEATAEPPRPPRPPGGSSSSGCSCSDLERDECADEQLGDMHFVYDNPCFANCEPYMDPVYKLYPDDCDTYCGPFTEIHWSEILIPKKVKLRGIKKSKPSPPTEGQPSRFLGTESPLKETDPDRQIRPPQSGPQTVDHTPTSELEINIGFTEIASTFIKVEGGADSQATVSEISTISDLRMQIKRCPKDYGVTLYMPTVGSQPFVAADNGTEKIAGLMVAVEPFQGSPESFNRPLEPQSIPRTNAMLDNMPKSASMPNMSISTLNSTEFRNIYPRAMNRPIAADYLPQGQKRMNRDEEQVLAIEDLSMPAKQSQTTKGIANIVAPGTRNPPCNTCGRQAAGKPDPQPDPTPEAESDKVKEEDGLKPVVPEVERPKADPIASETFYTCQPCENYVSGHAEYQMGYAAPTEDYGNLSSFTVKSEDFRKQYGIPPPKYEDPQCAGLYTIAMPQMEERTSNISAVMAQNREMAAKESISSPGVTKPPVIAKYRPNETKQKGSEAFSPTLVDDIGEKKVCKASCKAKMKSEQRSEEKIIEKADKRKPCPTTCGKQYKEEPKPVETKTEPTPVEDLAPVSREVPTGQSKPPCTGPCAQIPREMINIQEITDKEMKSINDEIEKIKRKLQEMHIPELDNWRNEAVEKQTCPCMQDFNMPPYSAQFPDPQQFSPPPCMFPTAQFPSQYPYNMPDYSMYTNVPSYSYPYLQSDGTEDMDYPCSCSRKRPTTRRQKKRRRHSSHSIFSDISSISGASKRSRGSRTSRGSRGSKSSVGSASSKRRKKGKRRRSSQSTVSEISSVSAGSKGSVSVGELTSYRRKSDKSTSQVSFQDTGCSSTQTDTEPEVEICVGKGPPRIRTKQNFKGFVSKDPHKNKFRVAVKITPSKLRTPHKQQDTEESSGF